MTYKFKFYDKTTGKRVYGDFYVNGVGVVHEYAQHTDTVARSLLPRPNIRYIVELA